MIKLWLFLNASKYCGSVLKNVFVVVVAVVVVVLVVADELLSNFQGILKLVENANLLWALNKNKSV